MRKPRDLDAELRALEDKTRSLKERRVRRLGELVAATGADALDAETLTGGLLVARRAPDLVPIGRPVLVFGRRFPSERRPCPSPIVSCASAPFSIARG